MLTQNNISKVFAFFLAIFMVGCTATGQLPSPEVKPLPDQAQQAIHSQNDFAFKLFNLVNQKEQDHKNKLISPLSIYMDLSMVYNGANHQTQKAMQQTLQLEDIDINLLNKTNAILLHNLPIKDSSVEIDIANAIWYRENLNPANSFLNTNAKYYNAKIQAAPFMSSTVQDINHWVKEKTHQKIKSIIDEIKPADLMFLLNAVYFKGDWTHKFDKKLTKKRTFHSPNGQEEVPFMYKKRDLHLWRK